MRKIVIATIILISFSAKLAFAPPPPPGSGTSTPLDSDILFLLIASVVFVIYKINRKVTRRI